MKTCVIATCRAEFVLDRDLQPWSRARTCSPACARQLGHRNRRPDNRHRACVEAWRLIQDTALRQREVPAGDEDLAAPTFGEWLRSYQWETEDVAA